MMTVLSTVVCRRSRSLLIGGLTVAVAAVSPKAVIADPLCMTAGCANGTSAFIDSANNLCGPGVSVAYFCSTRNGGRQLCHCPPADRPNNADTDDGSINGSGETADDQAGQQ